MNFSRITTYGTTTFTTFLNSFQVTIDLFAQKLVQILFGQFVAEQIDLLQIWTRRQMADTGMFGQFCLKREKAIIQRVCKNFNHEAQNLN